ncbi:SNED1 [Branchiostoma lanceolatum]|uniref:SNED1 protein n=1 Tax=Branchiostoma lanceolatum TaxID=7740 RepID=A0A8J9YM05_BRALA|nr:SNED1 [Branchiostoma lanceolatum]
MRQFILTTCLLGSLAVASSHIIPVSNAALYPYGPRTADILDARADDGTSGEQSLRTPFPFFGNTYNSLWVNTNGDISFGGAVTGYTPVAFPVTNNKVIAAFFTDIKTNNHGRSGYIYRRETTDAAILARATTDIQTAFPADHGSFVATWVYVATWHEVGLYGASGDGQNLRNTFQLVLITNGCKSFTLFNYHQIQFLQGESNGGSGATGTGPNPAQVGINGGNGIHFTLHPYSKSTDLRHLPAWTDPAVPGPPGRWYRRTDLATIGDRPAVLVCPRSYIKRRSDTCIKLHKKTLSYPDARASCVRDGAELFNIHSRADNEWLTRVLRQWQRRTGKRRDVWLGLTDEDTEGTFAWEDGTAFDATGYTNWDEGAPAANTGLRDCVFMSKRHGWRWYIQKCTGKWERDAGPNAYICAKNAVPKEPDC